MPFLPSLCRLFGQFFFKNLGVGPASSLLAGLNILFMIPLYVRCVRLDRVEANLADLRHPQLLYFYGARLRKRSKYGSS